jgi:hypothetical protein
MCPGIFGFAICGLGHKGNLRIHDLRTGPPRTFADLRCGMCPGIFRFAICGLPKKLRAHLCTLYAVLYVRVERVESTSMQAKKIIR